MVPGQLSVVSANQGNVVQLQVGIWDLSSSKHPDWLWGPPKPPSQWVPGAKQPGCEDDHPPSSSRAKN